MKLIKISFMVVICCSLALGCQKKLLSSDLPPHLIGDSAPKIGTTAATMSISDFIVGEWGYVLMTPSTSKKMDSMMSGLGAGNAPSPKSPIGGQHTQGSLSPDEKVDEVYEFKKDGSFTWAQSSQPVVSGHFCISGNNVSLVYELIGKKPIAQVQAEAKKDGEGGTQAGVMKDLLMDNLNSAMQNRSQLLLDEDGKSFSFGGGGSLLSSAGGLQRIHRG